MYKTKTIYDYEVPVLKMAEYEKNINNHHYSFTLGVISLSQSKHIITSILSAIILVVLIIL